MIPAYLPELTCESNILFLKDKFLFNLSDEEAIEEFEKMIIISLNSESRKIDNLIHIWTHN